MNENLIHKLNRTWTVFVGPLLEEFLGWKLPRSPSCKGSYTRDDTLLSSSTRSSSPPCPPRFDHFGNRPVPFRVQESQVKAASPFPPPPMELEHLSAVAKSVVARSSEILDTSVSDFVDSFEKGLIKVGTNENGRKLIEFCCSKVVSVLCPFIDEKIKDGYFTRLTFDMMLAWEKPSSIDERPHMESIAKEHEEKKMPPGIVEPDEDIPLFYSDLLPLLVDEKLNVGEDAFAWLSSVLPLAADIANARFVFETLAAPTANRLHFPAYDRYLREIDKSIKKLPQQTVPNGAELRDDEFILHVEGTASTPRVVRHIGGTSWPGRLTLTNYALYFEASAALSYENALKIDLSNSEVGHQVKAASTGPWGAPIFDKAMVYESTQLPEALVLEFPELTSSTRRDHWLTLTKEIILLHQFISRYKIEATYQRWETHGRTILGVIRLHAAREMLRICPPPPSNFLIFTLFEELPKGDYVMEELANELKQMTEIGLCSVTSLLKGLNLVHPKVVDMNLGEVFDETVADDGGDEKSPLETKVEQAREEAKDIRIAKTSIEGLKEESIAESLLVTKELLRPLQMFSPWLHEVLEWERPVVTALMISMLMLVVYKEWIGYAVSTCVLLMIGLQLGLRHKGVRDEPDEIIVNLSMDQPMMETVISAQHALNQFHSFMQTTNITLLKIHSLLISKSQKQSNVLMLTMAWMAIMFAVLPFRLVIMASILCCFLAKYEAKRSRSGFIPGSGSIKRRIKEWWDSIPVTPVRTIT
ncbi:uncharacterized protein LOC116247436 [Nymphaea colorata]|nr:uncharacterized protein LOC116247436 [Nymphaea colorata]